MHTDFKKLAMPLRKRKEELKLGRKISKTLYQSIKCVRYLRLCLYCHIVLFTMTVANREFRTIV